MLSAVTFDFWNTIASVPAGAISAARERAVAAACESCAVEVEAELLAASLAAAVSSYERSWSSGAHFHPREGAEILVTALGLEGAAREQAAAAFLGAGSGVELELAPDLRAALEALDESGVRLGIVCDVGFTGGELLREFLARQDLLHRFSGWGFSDEVGHYKPAPQIFEAALGALGAEPSAAVHVGDLRRTDVAGARALGMGTVRYYGLNDDPGAEGEQEADHLIASHRQLPGLLLGL